MKTSNEGYNLIKEFEKFEPRMYHCEAGRLTVGYGSRVYTDAEIFKYKDGISEYQATELLIFHCKELEMFVNKYFKLQTQSQFDALVSLLYNIGVYTFKKSKAFKLLEGNDYEKATVEMFDKKKGFVKCNEGILKGLVRRREAERKLWYKDNVAMADRNI